MSGSNDKRIRKQQREQGMDLRSERERQEAKKNKKQKRMAVGFLIAFVAVTAVVLALNSSFFYRMVSAVEIDGESYSVVEYNYYYYAAYQNEYYNGMAAYMIDQTKPLSSQDFDDTMSWQEHFKQTAQENMKNIKMLYDEAKNAGMTELDEKNQKLFDEAIEGLETAAKDAGTSVGTYLTRQYGKGMNMDIFKELQRKGYLANQYSQSVQDDFKDAYSNEEIEEYYVANADEYDRFTYRQYFVANAATATEDTAGEGAEGTDTVTDDAAVEAGMAEAKKKADKIGAAKDEEEYIELIDEYLAADTADTAEETEEVTSAADSTLNKDTAGSSIVGNDYAEWLLDSSRKEGDIEVIEGENGYYVLYFIERSGNEDVNLVNVRHILISPEEIEESIDSEDEEAVAAAEEEKKEEAHTEAERIFAEWKNGDATEESFAVLVNEYSDDTGAEDGGLYENVYPGAMVAEFNDWIFDESRKEGDVEIVETTYGYHIIYFVSETDQTFRHYLAEQDKLSEDYEAWQTEKIEKYNVKDEYFMRLAM